MADAPHLEDVARHLAAAVRTLGLYGTRHTSAEHTLATLTSAVTDALRHTPQITFAFLGDDCVIGHARLRGSAVVQGLVRRFRELGVEKVTLTRGLRDNDLRGLVEALVERSDRPIAERLADAGVQGVGLGLVEPAVPARAEGLGLVAARRVYGSTVAAAEATWQAALSERALDADAARDVIDALARAVIQDRTSIVALTAIPLHDPDTFTHMANVSVLTMAQSRVLGLNEQLIREFGLAGFLHDVGKARVPPEILTKPTPLDNREQAILQRHVIDGAQILRKTPGIPALVPIVAFEHHLRLDGTGYPERISPRKLNVCTMMVSIADAFDALRRNGAFRSGLPSERVRAMLAEQAGTAFEPTLLRRFTTLMGLYPVGSFVLLTSGTVGVVVEAHASDVYHPKVRVVLDQAGRLLPGQPIIDTSSCDELGAVIHEVAAAVDAANLSIDSLQAMGVDV
jgi:putative nucleotidyltransferase with HDIG domain